MSIKTNFSPISTDVTLKATTNSENKIKPQTHEISQETIDNVQTAAGNIGRTFVTMSSQKTNEEDIDKFLENFDANNEKHIDKIFNIYLDVTRGYTTCSNKKEYEKVYNEDNKISSFIIEKLEEKVMSDDTISDKFYETMQKAQGYKQIADNKPFALYYVPVN